MSQDNLAPEEKLLRLIKGGKKEGRNAFAENMQITLARQAKKPPAPDFSASLGLKKLILPAFVFACAYLAVSFSWPYIFTPRLELSKFETETTPLPKAEPAKTSRPLDYYLQQIRGRQIFANELARQQQTEARPASAAGADLIKDINLVGIISGDPSQVAIEDIKSRRTYYLTKGQSVGELTIDEIKEGKVIIDYKGQKFELYL
ncbi:MAG: hypothetical protein A3G38_01770 [Omnitrophica WOR_2 bacterium RIFCSPLOWO2_12_FULL_51_8]|nr:MAG: hypothetical protein A3G38_01770 [Omnitrophica WOR_2 bacterium RIFCSPLOWO2_12_FULL_51_8]